MRIHINQGLRLDPKIFTLKNLQVGECAYLSTERDKTNKVLYIKVGLNELIFVMEHCGVRSIGIAKWPECTDRKCTPPRKVRELTIDIAGG